MQSRSPFGLFTRSEALSRMLCPLATRMWPVCVPSTASSPWPQQSTSHSGDDLQRHFSFPSRLTTIELQKTPGYCGPRCIRKVTGIIEGSRLIAFFIHGLDRDLGGCDYLREPLRDRERLAHKDWNGGENSSQRVSCGRVRKPSPFSFPVYQPHKVLLLLCLYNLMVLAY